MGKLMVVRPHAKKPGHFTSEWLKGDVSKGDAGDEAMALLSDPRDTIVLVYYWSDRHAQFDGTWRKHDTAAVVGAEESGSGEVPGLREEA